MLSNSNQNETTHPGVKADQMEVNFGFWRTFFHSFFLIFISEFADKTFIMILVFTSKYQLKDVLIASLISLIGMNLFSISIGYCIDLLLYKNFIDYIAILVIIYLGVTLIANAWEMSSKVVEEKYVTIMNEEHKKRNSFKQSSKQLEEVDVMLNEEKKLNEPMLISANDEEAEEQPKSGLKLFWFFFSVLVIAECGDKTQGITIVISSVLHICGVIAGTTLGIIFIVLINIFIGHKISVNVKEKNINYVCGLTCILYGIEIYLVKIGIIS